MVSGSSSRRTSASAWRISRPPAAAIGLERARIADRRGHGPRSALHQLQRDVAGEPVGDDHVGGPLGDVPALDVADEVDPVSLAEQVVGGDHVGGALARFLADAEQPDPRSLDAEHRFAEGGAEEGELDQVLRADDDVGTDIEKEDRLARHRHPHGERRSLHPVQAPKAEVAAAIAAPVEPTLARASLPPPATSAAARTIEAPSRERTALTGSSWFETHSLVAITSIPSASSSESSAGGPNTRTPIPSAAASLAPSASTLKPCSAPKPSRATVTPACSGIYSSGLGAAGASVTVCVITSRPA